MTQDMNYSRLKVDKTYTKTKIIGPPYQYYRPKQINFSSAQPVTFTLFKTCIIIIIITQLVTRHMSA